MDTNTIFNTNSYVVEEWHGGYKLQLDLTPTSDIENWQLKFDLPYNISELYGVEIVDKTENNNGTYTYTVKGEESWVNLSLSQGQSTKPILIVEDNVQEAVPLNFNTPDAVGGNSNSFSEDSQDAISSFSKKAQDAVSSDSEDSQDTVSSDSEEAQDVVSSDSEEAQDTVSSDSEDTQDVVSSDSEDAQDAVLTTENNGTIINVDQEFGGDLAAAIASAEDGHTLELSNKTYYTSGITIDKDITISGQEGTIIDGGGTSNSIINITQGATGATIQNIDITNGNNGIYGYGASNLTLQDLEVYNIGNNERMSGGQNNTGIILNYTTGVKLINSEVYDVSRNGVSIGDTVDATIDGLKVREINLAAQHSQSHDAAGIKFFNTSDVVLKNSHFSNINANNIWNDTTTKTTIENNTIENVGSAFLKPSFDTNVDISGIYNEKSHDSVVKNNNTSSSENFAGYNGTEFTTETATLEGNDFSIIEINTEDYWVNEYAEKLIATTEDPAEADFDLIKEIYLAGAAID